MIIVYVILGITGFCILLFVLYQCSKSSEVAEYDDYQENGVKQDNNMEPSMPPNPEYEARNNFHSSFQTNTYGANNPMTPSSNLPHSLGEPSGNQNERQENNLNPAFNPTFNPTAIEMPPNPEYEARNRFPSSFQTNTYGANNHMTPSSNLPYSLTPGEANGNQKGSEPAYAGGWVNQSYKHTE